MVPGISLLGSFAAESGLTRADDGLCSIGDLQLGEDVGDVVADRFGAEVEALRYLGVRLVTGDEDQDLAFPVGKLGEGFRGRVRAGCGEILHQTPGDCRAEDGLATRHRSYGAQDLGL